MTAIASDAPQAGRHLRDVWYKLTPGVQPDISAASSVSAFILEERAFGLKDNQPAVEHAITDLRGLQQDLRATIQDEISGNDMVKRITADPLDRVFATEQS